MRDPDRFDAALAWLLVRVVVLLVAIQLARVAALVFRRIS